eukprot:jgi/Undpi1/3366/HiC_scaffold_15.g06739.m1
MASRCRRVVAGLLISAAMLPDSADAFLSGAPGPRNYAAPPSEPDSKTKLDDLGTPPVLEEVVGPSPLDCEVLTVEDFPDVGSSGPKADPELSTVQARAIALEAATSKTVPKTTLLEALHCLADSADKGFSNGAAPLPVEAVDGVWRLCFCQGAFLEGVAVDNHGYISREQEVDMRIDAKEEKVVLGSRGLCSSLPKVVRGGLAYSQETQTVTGTFDKESVGIDDLVLKAFLVDEDALGFHTVVQGQPSFVLFHAEKGKAAAARLSKDAVALPSKVSDAKKAATALDLKVDLKLISDENNHEDKRLAVQETGRKTGSFNTFMRYLETEGAMIYAVLAGPVMLSFVRAYNPIAATKASAAAIVLRETFRHLLETST